MNKDLPNKLTLNNKCVLNINIVGFYGNFGNKLNDYGNQYVDRSVLGYLTLLLLAHSSLTGVYPVQQDITLTPTPPNATPVPKTRS